MLDGAVAAGFPGVIAYLDDGGHRGAWRGAAGVSGTLLDMTVLNPSATWASGNS